ncbi:MAG TPA: SDR family oxidoreductase [Thermoanaerobaculia bacterium]|jgi:NAD(P)-dependent dehydrogenase (short-subunit alcohol dehydrogenase family)
MEFQERIAVITGASSGIGASCARKLAERGARVVLFARSLDKLREIAARHEDRMLAVSGDVAEEADIERLFAETESRFGACDLLINNAGMIDPKPMEATSADDWDRMFAVNVRGAFLCARRALRAMPGGAAIVNVASISGVAGPEKFPGWISYCASKGAVISMTEAMAVELKGRGVRVNCVSPGSVDTKMWAEASGGAPADMTPDEVAETILFLASERSRPMNGQNVNVW